MSDETHSCPKDGCDVRLSPAVLACRPHWFSLPPELRGRIGRLWRKGDLVAYLEARDEVVAFLNGEAS